MYCKLINISMVDGCNLKCRWCDRPEGFKFMDLSNLKEIVHKINEEVVAAPLLQIIGAGEVFLHPDLLKALEIIKKIKIKNLRFEIWTNGTIIKEEQLRDILSLNLLDGIVFSFDGYGDKETFEYIRQGANYNKVIENINLACRIKNEIKNKCQIGISTIIPKEGDIPFKQPNEEIIKEKYRAIFPNIDNIMFRQVHRYNGSFEVDGMPMPKEGIIGPCDLLEGNSLIVDAEGYAHPCCNDINHLLRLGNLLETSIDSIYNGNRIKNMKESLRNGNEVDVCQECDFCKYSDYENLIRTLMDNRNRLYEQCLEAQINIQEKQCYIDEQQEFINKQQNEIYLRQQYIDQQQAYIDKINHA